MDIRRSNNQAGEVVFLDVDVAMRDANQGGDAAHEELYLGLTPEGGLAWEQFARPDWTRFIQQEADDGKIIITCMDEQWLVWAVQALLGLPDPQDGRLRNRQPVGEWEATYWKTLPHGMQMRLNEADCTPQENDPDMARLALLCRFWCEFRPI